MTAPAQERVGRPGALLSRGDLGKLGLSRRAVDAVFGVLPQVLLPGFSRPFVRAVDYQQLLDQHTYRDGERVMPGRR